MKKYELTDKDIKFADNLIRIVRFVENAYIELYEAEASHEKDEYILSHIYDLLNDSLCEEQRVMSYLKDGDPRINDIINYISKKYNYNDSYLDDVCVSMIDTSQRDIKRAIALLNDKRINYNINKTNKDIIEKGIVNMTILKDAIDLDYYLGYLYFMEENINDQMDLSVRRELIKCKYNLYYLNPRLEKIMLDSKFVVNNNLCQVSKMTADYLGVSSAAYYDLLHFEGCTSASDNIDNIINLKYEDLDKDVVRLLSFSAFVKSALLMMSDETVTLLEEKTTLKIENLPEEDYYKKDILYRLFWSLRENRSKSFTISLKCK